MSRDSEPPRAPGVERAAREQAAAKAEVIAHRGFSGIAPENTCAAFEEALAWSVDGLEWDLHVSADGVPVVIHDETVDRTTDGSGLVREMTLDALKRLDAGSWFGPEFRGERIPTLDEALQMARGRVARVYPEIKECPTAEAMAHIIEALRAHGFGDTCVVLSLDWDLLRLLRSLDRDMTIGFLVERESRFHGALAEARADGRAILACDYRILLRHPMLAQEAHRHEIELGAWTVDDPEDAQRLLALGVTRLTTNEVATLIQHLGHRHR